MEYGALHGGVFLFLALQTMLYIVTFWWEDNYLIAGSLCANLSAKVGPSVYQREYFYSFKVHYKIRHAKKTNFCDLLQKTSWTQLDRGEE